MSVKEITISEYVPLKKLSGLIMLIETVRLRSMEDVSRISMSHFVKRKFLADAQLIVTVCINNRNEKNRDILKAKISRAITHCICGEISVPSFDMVLAAYLYDLEHDIKRFTEKVYDEYTNIIRDDDVTINCVLSKNMCAEFIFVGKERVNDNKIIKWFKNIINKG